MVVRGGGLGVYGYVEYPWSDLTTHCGRKRTFLAGKTTLAGLEIDFEYR